MDLVVYINAESDPETSVGSTALAPVLNGNTLAPHRWIPSKTSRSCMRSGVLDKKSSFRSYCVFRSRLWKAGYNKENFSHTARAALIPLIPA